MYVLWDYNTTIQIRKSNENVILKLHFIIPACFICLFIYYLPECSVNKTDILVGTVVEEDQNKLGGGYGSSVVISCFESGGSKVANGPY